MSYVRILVNGDGLLENWTNLAPDFHRQSFEARDELVDHLTHFYDVTGIPMTVVFDDIVASDGEEEEEDATPPDIQVVFTQKRNRTEQSIERIARRLRSSGPVQIIGEGPNNTPYQSFIAEVQEALQDLKKTLDSLHESEPKILNHTL